MVIIVWIKRLRESAIGKEDRRSDCPQVKGKDGWLTLVHRSCRDLVREESGTKDRVGLAVYRFEEKSYSWNTINSHSIEIRYSRNEE